MTDHKLPRKKLMLAFFTLQTGLGFIFLFNKMPFDYTLRAFGVILIALSPMWLVLFTLFRTAKIREFEKKTENEEKQKMDEEI